MKELNENQNGGKPIEITIDLEDVFNGKQKHHDDDNDPGTIIIYVIKVDKIKFKVRKRKMNGREILSLVGLTPETHRLFELGKHHQEIQPDEVVDFKKTGIERFKSVAKHANEGKEAALAASSFTGRQAFAPLEEDADFLNKHYEHWETLQENGSGWILLHHFAVPEGYNVEHCTLAVMVPPSYPTTEMDMMYFYPALSRKDGKPIGALSAQGLDSKSFQRWSRHRNAGQWKPGIDNLETHVLSIEGWLIDELKKR